jgi:hypothetical protein
MRPAEIVFTLALIGVSAAVSILFVAYLVVGLVKLWGLS